MSKMVAKVEAVPFHEGQEFKNMKEDIKTKARILGFFTILLFLLWAGYLLILLSKSLCNELSNELEAEINSERSVGTSPYLFNSKISVGDAWYGFDDYKRLISLSARLTKVDKIDRPITKTSSYRESLDEIEGVDTLSYILGPKLGGQKKNAFAQNLAVHDGLWRETEEKIVGLVDEAGSALVSYSLEYEPGTSSRRPIRITISVLRDYMEDQVFVVDNPKEISPALI